MANSKWHDKNGKFKSNNPGGGRKPKAKELSYLAIVTEVVTEEEFRQGLRTAWGKAKRGDVALLRFFTEYILGKPTQDVSVETFAETKITLTWDDDDAEPDASEAP